MGLESVTKQANASVLIIGFDSLAAEIAKNIVLSGVKRFNYFYYQKIIVYTIRLTIFDKKIIQKSDLLGNFFLEEVDIGKPRIEASLRKI